MKTHDMAAPGAGFGTLAFLSLQHSPRGSQPEAFTNEERVQAFRNALPVPPAIARPARFTGLDALAATA